MERKYRSQKTANIVFAIICVLLIGLVVFLQIRMNNVKAEETKKYDKQVAELTGKIETMQAEFDAKNYKDEIKALKATEKEKKNEVKDLEKALKELQEASAPTEG